MGMFKLEILTPNGIIFKDDVVDATFPGEEGEFGVVEHHAALTTLLQVGVIEITTKQDTVEAVLIDWGVVQVDDTNVTVLADGAVAIKGTDESVIAKAIEEAKELMKSVAPSSAVIASVSARLETVAKQLLL